MYEQFCNETKSCAYLLVNETLWYETETRPRRLIFNPRRDRDLLMFPRDRDETETFGNYVSRPSRDRDVETETTSLRVTDTEAERQLLHSNCPRRCRLTHLTEQLMQASGLGCRERVALWVPWLKFVSRLCEMAEYVK